MSRSTVSTFQLLSRFPDQESARIYLESRLWPAGAICAQCLSGDRITARVGGMYHCNACNFDFSVRTNTIFERSKIPLHKWLYSMYLLVTARKGISSMQLAKEIGITQKSAWFVLGRLREACGGDLETLGSLRLTKLSSVEKRKTNTKRRNSALDRLDSFVDRTAGKRLTYARLTR